MPKVTIDQTVCKGCELCAAVCPQHILALSKDNLNAKGYHPMEVVEPEKCIGCAFCAIMCPDCAIVVER
ncbi:MAG TPA: 4Fe-4S binding protein [Clostridia bacterium]|nr:4Fe-4S binding protein [Clostridia bacterium]